jgi:hypothetical protein
MTEKPAFSIDIRELRSRHKETTPTTIDRIDRAAEDHGFVKREGQGRRGRRPSPRTQQLHCKLLPPIADEIAEEARRRGVQQGVVIEEAWALYKAEREA